MQQQNHWSTDKYCIIETQGNQKMKPYDPEIIPKIQKFIDQLQCQKTKALDSVIYCCGQPAIVLQTFDGYYITFIIAKGMVKVSGLAHTFKNNKTKQTSQCSQCLYRISKLFRDVIISGFNLPKETLATDQQLKSSYEYYMKH